MAHSCFISSPSSPAFVPLIVTNFKRMQCLLQPALNSLPVNYSMEPSVAQFHIQSQACYCGWWAFGFSLKCKQVPPKLLHQEWPGAGFPHIHSLQCRWQVAVISLIVEWAFRGTHGVATPTLGLPWILWVWLDGVLACWVFRTRTCQGLVVEQCACGSGIFVQRKDVQRGIRLPFQNHGGLFFSPVLAYSSIWDSF